LLVKRFRERNRALTGAVGIVVTLVLIVAALNFERLPLIHNNGTYSADFSSAGGLDTGDIVTIDGVKVGSITGMALDGDKVKVTFTVQPGLRLGSTTSASAQVLSPVGTEYMELSPSGPGNLSTLIPESRTTVPYNLVTDLSGLGTEIQEYNIPELEKSLEVGSQDLNATSAKETIVAFNGLARFSNVLGNEQSALATIVSQGAALSGVLSQRSHQLFDLFGQGNLVLNVLEQRRAAIRELLTSTTELSQQITSILSVNRSQLTTLLQSLQSVSAILEKDSNNFGQAIPVLAAFSRYAANTTGSGPFADVSVPTLLIPDNLIDQCSSSKSFPSSNPQVGCRP
jgi:phospholipid/cholesterol/gamma-HCH transport system substrate-binding protein